MNAQLKSALDELEQALMECGEAATEATELQERVVDLISATPSCRTVRRPGRAISFALISA